MYVLQFHYEMKLELDQEVKEHHFLVRLRPMETARQRCLEYACHVEPKVGLSEVTDGFGNHGYAGLIWPPHRDFSVWARGRVQVEEELEQDFHPMYRYPSGLTTPGPQIEKFLQDTEAALGHTLCDARDLEFLMGRLAQAMIYVPGVTSTRTPAETALSGGRGVCQDYAHIFISLCRLAGFPARYAAGLMLGEGATHAWAEVWTENGWLGFDPTNHRMTDHGYIKLAHGRDFTDGAVDKGCFLGFASQKQQIYVKVEEET